MRIWLAYFTGELVFHVDLENTDWFSCVSLLTWSLLCFLCFQVINGLLERPDWEEAIRTPLGILPGGSGNALAASIHHYSG